MNTIKEARITGFLNKRLCSLELRLQPGCDCKQIVGDGSCFCDGVGEGDIGDFGAAKNNEAAELPLMNEVDRSGAVTRCQHAVEGGGGATTLSVAEVDV